MRFPDELLNACWFLAGPTACGKSDVALCLAELCHRHRGHDLEIVSLDSMTLYRRMDIGTAKPSPEDRQIVPHHLFDILEPSQDFSVAEYLASAEHACREIVARDATPLFVGGTGLYLRSVLRGVFDGPSADDTIRRRLEADAAREGTAALFERLRHIDPTTSAKLHPNDLRRVIRALEVYELTGFALSQQHREEPRDAASRPRNVFWLSPPRDWLAQRINQRVNAMIQAGWLDEVRSLLAEPLPLSHTARQALGYKELIDHLSGACSLDEAVKTIQTRTRQFAKRQHTWFRHLEECREISITGDERPAEIAARLIENIS